MDDFPLSILCVYLQNKYTLLYRIESLILDVQVHMAKVPELEGGGPSPFSNEKVHKQKNVISEFLSHPCPYNFKI